MINIGIGVAWAKSLYSVANNIIANFRARVLSYPNSIFEAGPCLDATLEELNAVGLLDDASLIVTPNAYNEGVLYDVIPNTPLGDMDVVRATTATRVNSAGLIEVVPRNLLTYSNTFTNAVWANGGYGNIATVIANDIISPDGLMNGSKITFSAGVTQARLIQQTSVINGGIYQASIFVKYGNKNTIDFYCDAAITGLFATFNFTTKVLTASGVSNTIVTELPNGWFRLQYTYTAPSATSQIGFISNIGADGFVYAYGGQAEQGSTATEYFPTTTRLNIPRIDYTNGSCPSLLVEPQRTNLALRSQELDSALIWFTIAATVTANNTTSPDGTVNADKVIATAVTSTHIILQQPAGSVIGTTSTVSIFAKASGLSNIQIVNNAGGFGFASYNLSAGTASLSSGVSASIQNYGNGWYRCIMTYTPTTSGNYNIQIRLADSSGNTTFLGNGVDGVFLWGFQVEAGAYPTSYIPTIASSVTRNADVISRTGISGLIGQTEGTVFVDANLSVNANERRLITISNGNEIQRLFIWTIGTTLWVSFNSGSINLGNFPIGTAKIAVGYTISGSDTTYSIKVNNNSLVTGTTANAPNSLNTINLGSTAVGALQLNDRINSVQLYKTRLSNSELASLTTI